MIWFRLSNVLKKNSLRDVVPTQSVQRSCSMERDRKEGEIATASDGALVERVISRQAASLLETTRRIAWVVRRRRGYIFSVSCHHGKDGAFIYITMAR